MASKGVSNPSQLIISTLKSSLLGVIALGIVLFIPAGTLDYWQAWVFIAVFLSCAIAIGIYLSINDPELLERRKQVGPTVEQRTSQKIIMAFTIVGCIALLVIPALDHRFGWSPVPPLVSLAGDALVALGFLFNFFAIKENSYAASSIRIFEGQKVISTGAYALVRHPMYSGVLLMLIGTTLALDSWLGLVIVALILPVLVWRILDEEDLLKKELPGYLEYVQKTRYRLVPYFW